MLVEPSRPPQTDLSKKGFGPVKLVIVQPTTFCNLDCDYCYLPERQEKHKLSLELLEPIFTSLFSSNLIEDGFTVVWHAGEPLTMPISYYESAFQIIGDLNKNFNSYEYNISHSFQTNGTLINQAWCDLIKKYRIRIGVSVDGPDYIHNSHRKTRKGIGTHAGTMRGISLLKTNNIEFHTISVLTQKSLNYPDEIFEFFVENNIQRIGFNIEEIEGINQFSSLNSPEVEERYRKFMERFYTLVKSTDFSIQVREFEHIRREIIQGRGLTVGQFTPFAIINVDYKGDFTTYSPELLSMSSSTYGDFIIGNVLNDSFEKVVDSDKFRKMNGDVLTGIDLCRRSCQYFSLCGGGAPSNKYFENGTFCSAETMFCKYNKKVIADIVLEDIERELGLR